MSIEYYFVRAKRTDHNEWVEGLLTVMWGQYHIINPTDENTAYPIYLSTVCRYTGLTDSTSWEQLSENEQENFLAKWNYKEERHNVKEDWNGKKIFEGDIITFTDIYSADSGYAEGNCIGEVLWDEEELCFHVTERISAESWEVLQDCYVIGNNFDNPEF